MPQNQDKIRLEWRHRGSDYPFLAYHLSDGTLRFMCLATLLLQPELPSTILIDEPELGLHPYAITVLASLIAKRGHAHSIDRFEQSVSASQSVPAKDLLIVDVKERASEISRPDPNQW